MLAILAMMQKNVDKKFWAKAANTAMYTTNRTETSTVKGKTLYALLENFKNLEFIFRLSVCYIPK